MRKVCVWLTYVYYLTLTLKFSNFILVLFLQGLKQNNTKVYFSEWLDLKKHDKGTFTQGIFLSFLKFEFWLQYVHIYSFYSHITHSRK